MNCQLIDQYVFDYCENNVSPALREKIDHHLAECQRCSQQVNLTCLENEFLTDKSDLPDLPDDFTDKVMLKIRSSEQKAAVVPFPQTKTGRVKFADLILTAAVMGLVVLLVIVTPQLIPSSPLTQVSERQTPNQAEDIGTLETGSGQDAAAMKVPDDAGSAKSVPPTVKQESTAPSPAVTTPEEPVMIALNDADISERAYTFAADQAYPSRMGSDSVMDNKNSTAAMAPIHPVQLPDNFRLVEVYDTDDPAVDELIYNYTDERNRLLVIRISSTVSESEPAALMMSQAEPVKEEAEASSSAEKTVLDNLEVSFTVQVNDQDYEVTLNGALPADEMGTLAQNLKFEAGIIAPTP